MISPDGMKVILITTIFLIISLIITYFFPYVTLKILTAIIGIVFLFNFYFFRDPNRNIPEGDDLILSPADGTVISIDQVEEPHYFKKKVLKISIFLSVFDVHVNRAPLAGRISASVYVPGAFVNPSTDKESEDNERRMTVITTPEETNALLFKSRG